MSELATIALAMRELATWYPDVLKVLHPSEHFWRLRLAQNDITAEYDAVGRRLIFITQIAPLPHTQREAAMAALLTRSMPGHTIGGMHMALNAPGGDVVQIADLHADGVSAETIRRVVSHLAERSASWARFLSGLQAPQTPSLESMLPTMHTQWA